MYRNTVNAHLVPKWQFGLEARAQPYFAFKEWDRLLPLLILVSELQQISRLFYHWTTVVAWLGKPYYKKRPRHLGIARKGGGGVNPCPDGQLRQLWQLKLTQKVTQSARLSAQGGDAKAIRVMPKCLECEL